jgi:hypothetical protein
LDVLNVFAESQENLSKLLLRVQGRYLQTCHDICRLVSTLTSTFK